MGENTGAISSKSNSSSGVILNSRLKEVLNNACTDVASPRTMKYCVGDGNFTQRLSDVCDTIEAIRCTKGATVVVGDDTFSIKDYQIPNALVEYVRSGEIYASRDAIGKAEPLITAKRVEAKLSPLAFNKFFADFNSTQTEGYQIKTRDQWDREVPISLEDVQYLEDESGRLAKLHENGFSAQTCYLIGVKVDGLSQYLAKYEKPTKDGMTAWLLQS